MNGGWNRPSAPPVQKRESGRRRGAVWMVAAGVAALSVVAVLFLVRDGGRPPQAAEDGGGRASKAARTDRPADVRKVVLPKIEPRGEDAEWKRMKETPRGTNVAVREGMPVPAGEPPRREGGRQICRNAVEQLLAMACSSDPTVELPPIPVTDDDMLGLDAIERGLDHPMTAEEGDTEADIQRRIDIHDLKEQFRRLRDEEGMSFSQYVRALREQNNSDARFYAEACRLDSECYHDEGMTDESYRDFRKQINEKLHERGLPDLPSADDGADGEDAAAK